MLDYYVSPFYRSVVQEPDLRNHLLRLPFVLAPFLWCRSWGLLKVSLTPLWDWQKEAIARAEPLDAFGLLCDPGVGKTRTQIEIMQAKYKKAGRVLRTLIVCPQVVMQNWRAELLKYSDIDREDIVILKGTGAQRRELLMKAADLTTKAPKIFIVNYEGLLMEKLYEAFQWYGFEMIIADESHRVKNPSSKRTKALVALSRTARFKYIMTGTPVLQSPLDLFSQFQFLDGGETFAPVGNNFFAFRHYFFYNANANKPAHVTWPDWKIRPGAVDQISEKIKAKTIHVKKEECLDLPPMVRKEVPVELSKEQRIHYEMMKKAFITFIEDKACSAQLAITKALRLQQITSGFIQTEDGATIQLKENPRLEALEDLLEDLVLESKKKVIIWACWKENYKQIASVLDRLKISYVEVHGEVSSASKQAAIDNFCNNEETKVFLANQGAGGIGINLVQASYAIYYSRSFSLEHDIQSEARNYRGGSNMHESITRIDLVAQGTIDEVILQALASKQEMSDKVLRDVAKRL